jgi:hypothetical protein
MERHMEQEINLVVSEYVRTGISRIARWKMYAAYDAQRLGVNVWRDVKERIRDQGGDFKLAKIIETDGDIIFVKTDIGSSLSSKI